MMIIIAPASECIAKHALDAQSRLDEELSLFFDGGRDPLERHEKIFIYWGGDGGTIFRLVGPEVYS